MKRRLAALSALRQQFSGENGSSDPRSKPVRWDDVVDLAEELRVAQALPGTFSNSSNAVPPAVAERMQEARLVNTVRNLRMRRSMTGAIGALNQAGVVPLLFKGAIELATRTPRASTDRWTMDLDFLVREHDLATARAALEGEGYSADTSIPFRYQIALVRPNTPVIELHIELGSPPVPAVLPTTEAWDGSSEVLLDGTRARILSPTHEVLHNILHSAVQDLNHAVAALPMRQLLTLSRLVKAHRGAIDWAWIDRRMARHGLERTLRDHLWLAHRFAGMPLPPGPWGARERFHELRVLVNFGLGWSADVHRNLRFAFSASYLDSKYQHGGNRWLLLLARARHSVRLIRRDGAGVLEDLFARRQ